MRVNHRFIQVKYFKGGHRYFRDILTGQLAIADESGHYPSETDDGVLYVDFTRPAETYGRPDGSIGYNVPCIPENHWLQGMDDQGTFPQGTNCFGMDVQEFRWLEGQGVRLKSDFPRPRLQCPKCDNYEFTARQQVNMDVIVDEEGNWLRNQGNTAEASIYHADHPFGPFVCTECETEVIERHG